MEAIVAIKLDNFCFPYLQKTKNFFAGVMKAPDTMNQSCNVPRMNNEDEQKLWVQS